MNNRRILAIVAGAVLVLGGCGPRSPQPPAHTPQPAQFAPPSNDPTPQPPPTEQPLPQPAVIEVTRAIVVTHTVEIVVTATPDIQGFTAPAMPTNVGTDEGPQPCPARYWKSPDPRSEGIGTMTEDRGRGRCTATAAQIEQYAHEVQP